MDEPSQITEFGKILIIGIMGALLVLVTLLLGKIISPKKPTPEKLSTYECGEETIGSSWVAFNPRFYVIALVFLLFDVELIFVFPWSTVFGRAELMAADARWGVFTLIEMAVFIGILVIGLLYVWKKGDLEWIKSRNVTPRVNVNIPKSAYDQLNRKAFPIRKFEPEVVAVAAPKPSQSQSSTTETKKPAFKPVFRKPGGTSS